MHARLNFYSNKIDLYYIVGLRLMNISRFIPPQRKELLNVNQRQWFRKTFSQIPNYIAQQDRNREIPQLIADSRIGKSSHFQASSSLQQASPKLNMERLPMISDPPINAADHGLKFAYIKFSSSAQIQLSKHFSN